MQIQINNPDGTLKRIETLGEFETPQLLVDHVRSVSGEDAGYFVVAGDNLDGGSTREVAHVVCAQGATIWQNLFDPE